MDYGKKSEPVGYHMTLIPLLRRSPNELEAKASTTAITCKYGQPHNSNSGTTHSTQLCLNRHYMHLPHSYTQNAHASIHKHTYEEVLVAFRMLLLSYRAMLHLKATRRYHRLHCKELTLGQGRGVFLADPSLALARGQHLPGNPLLGAHQSPRIFMLSHKHAKGWWR